MSKDFRIKQLRTTQLIASGSSVGTVPSLLIYSASAATNVDGGLHTDLLSSVGTDVWMFVSGSKAARSGSATGTGRSDAVLFGGDVVISGTLYAEKQVMEVDTLHNSDLLLSGALVLGDQAAGSAANGVGSGRIKNLLGQNSGSLFVSTGSLYFATKPGGTYKETKLETTTLANFPVATINVANDSIVFIDADDSNNSKQETVSDFVDLITGAGLVAAAGQLSVNIDGLGALGGTGLHQTDDHFIFSDGGTEKKITFSNLEDAIFGNVSGDATIAAGGDISLGVAAITNQTEMTGDVDDADELLINDGGALKRVDFSVLRDAVFNDISGDAAVAGGGVLTIGSTAVEGTMLNTNVADTSTIEVSSNTLSVLKVPNALTAGTGIDAGGTFDGAAARTITVSSAQTGIQSVTKDDFTTLGRAGSANDVIDFSTAGSVKIKTNNVDRVAINDTTTIINNTLAVSGDIQRDGDTDTKISFLDDRITITAGNVSAIDVIENGASSEVVVNEASNATMDFRVETDNLQKAVYTNAELDYVSIGDDTGVKPDTHLFVSGTIGGAGTEGVAVFGGDVVISGSLLDASHNAIKLLSYKENGTFTNPPTASGTNSVAIGNNAVASGNNSIAMGTSTTNQTDATGIHSLAIGGDDATASGQYSAAIGGYQNTASGDYSVTLGRGNTASQSDAIAIGKSLTVNSADTIAIGNNSDNADIQLKGDTTVAGTSTLEGDVTLGNSADLIIPAYIKHKSDINTHFGFNNDRIRLTTNNATNVDINSTQVIIAPGAGDAPAESEGLDVAFYVSGSVATQGTSVRATSLFGGDVHISGSLSGPGTILFDNTDTKIFRDGNNLTFDDGNNTAKTLSQLATVPGDSAFINGVHAGSNNAKAATSASFSIAGTQGASYYTENIGSDVLLYVSGGLRSDTAAYGKTTSVFGGAVVFSGSATYLGDTSFSLLTVNTAVKTPVIQDASGNETIRINSQKVAVGNSINANPTAIFEAPLADNTQAATTNESSHFNIFLNNRSVQTNAFAGIAFDVSTEVDADSIGAAIRAERDTSASTTAANHDANLTFSTNDAGDAGLTERMRITHDGKVGIGVDPSYKLDIDGDLRLRGNDIRDNSGNIFISGDGSANTLVANDLTVSGGDIFGPVDGDLNIKSDGNLTFVLDNDNDETSQKLLVQNTSSDIFEITETGDVVVGGDLFVYGDDIKDSGDNIALSFDGSGNVDNNVSFTGTPSFGDNTDFADKLRHAGDTDTCVRFPAANKVSAEAGGVGMFLLDGSASPKVAVFNEAGQDHDFRVETNNETHMFFIDGSTNRIGMGIDSPSTTLQIKGATADETTLQLQDSQSSDTIIKLYHANGEDDGIIDLYANNTVTARINANGMSMLGGDGTAEPSLLIVRRDNSTTTNDLLGGIGFDSSDGNVPATILNASAFIAAYAAESHSVNDKGGYLVLGTSAINDDDDTASVEQLRVGSDGLITLAGNLKVGGNIIQNSEGTTTITMDADEDIVVAGDIQVGGGILEGPTDGDLDIKSDGNITFVIDNDNDETSQAFSFKNTSTEVAQIDESGNFQADGDIRAITYFPLERMVKISSSDTSGTGDEKLTGKGNTSGTDFTSGYLNKDATENAFIAPCDGYVDACSVITEHRLLSDSGSDIIYIKMYKLAAQSDFDDASPAWTAVGTTMTISEANHSSWAGFGAVAGGTQLTKRTGIFTTWGDGDDSTYDTSDGSANLKDSWTFSRGDKIIFTIRYDAGNDSNPFYDDVANGYTTSTTTVNFTWTLGLNWNIY